MTYTIYTRNTVLGTGNFSGTYATIDDAVAEAARLASKSRSFVQFEIYEGTPKMWGRDTGRRDKGRADTPGGAGFKGRTS